MSNKHKVRYEWVICPHCHNKLCKNFLPDFEIEIKCHGCKAVYKFFKIDVDSDIQATEIEPGNPKRHHGNKHYPTHYK